MSAPLRIAVVGAGAIGGWVGAKLAATGRPVSALARGDTLAALEAHGFRLLEDGVERSFPVTAAESAAALGVQDLVIVAVKGPALAAVASAVAELCGPQTVVVSMMNGLPWWFFAGEAGRPPLRSVDPEGAIAERIPFERVLGCVVHAACATAEPGKVVHRNGKGLILGEAVGGPSARLEAAAEVFREAGFDVTVSERIQRDIWYKLWGNMTMNPISALTGTTCDRILDDPLVNGFVLRIMAEAAELGARIGCPISESGADRNAVTRKLGAFKTSMLQDVEAGRPIELDALLGAPREIAQQLGLATPAMDALLGLTRVFAQARGVYHD